MPKMRITGADARLNGEYEVTMPPWTKREWYLVKKQCDVIASDFVAADAEAGGKVELDMNLLTAIGFVSLHRAGQDALIPLFWETDDDQVVFDFSDQVEGDAGPPTQTESESENGSPGRSDESSEPSGNGSSNGGDLSGNDQSPTGIPPSHTSSISDHATSEI